MHLPKIAFFCRLERRPSYRGTQSIADRVITVLNWIRGACGPTGGDIERGRFFDPSITSRCTVVLSAVTASTTTVVNVRVVLARMPGVPHWSETIRDKRLKIPKTRHGDS